MKQALRTLACLALAGSLAAALPAHAGSNAAFDKLKALAGEWQGKATDGKTVKASYEVVSSGTAVMERLETPDEMNMITVYHKDGDRLMLTHYCAANNQPRMKAEPGAGDAQRLVFTYVDATNLSGGDAGHMHGLTLSFDDPNHFTQEWTWKEPGKDGKEVFRFERKK